MKKIICLKKPKLFYQKNKTIKIRAIYTQKSERYSSLNNSDIFLIIKNYSADSFTSSIASASTLATLVGSATF